MIKVNLILGFLGAGKTTLIKSVLQKGILKDEQVVLVVNDYGPENYDSRILRKTGVEIVEITNGCLCCNNQDGFQKILIELSHREDIDRIIIEPSGLFFPDQVISEFEKDPLKSFLKLEPIFAVVDMAFLARTNRAWPPFISRHIEFADCIITNKQEKISAAQSESIKNHLGQINSKALQTNFSAAVENFRYHHQHFSHKITTSSDEGHEIKLEVITKNISFKDIDALKSYFEEQSEILLRAKGIVLIDGKKVFINYTQSSWEAEEISTSQPLALLVFTNSTI